MITGSVYIALPEIEDWLHQSNADRGALFVMESCPDGARVVVDIGGRRMHDMSLLLDLRAYGRRLDIDIRGTDPDAVADLVRAARTGSWDVVA